MECPRYIEAFLLYLQEEMSRCFWNKFQEEWDDAECGYSNPWTNSGNVEGFDNGTFEVHAYDWGDEEQEYNFKFEDIEISWYKYFGRGMAINKEITPERAIEMLEGCLNSLLNGWNNKLNNENKFALEGSDD